MVLGELGLRQYGKARRNSTSTQPFTGKFLKHRIVGVAVHRFPAAYSGKGIGGSTHIC